VGSLRKKTHLQPVPDGAEFFIKSRKSGKNIEFARWDGMNGRETARVKTLSDGSKRVVIETGNWLCKFRDGSGDIRELSTNCSDRQAAKAILADHERRAQLVKSGILTAAEDAVASQQPQSLSRHFAAFRESVDAKERDETHCKTTVRYLERLADGCSWGYLRDISRDSFERWMAARVKEGTSARTRNGFQTALTTFLNWCVERNRLTANPLAGLSKANEKADRRRQRRALTEHELHRLLDATRRRPLVEAMTIRWGDRKGELAATVKPAVAERLRLLGRERALTYKTLTLTGLRKSELASIDIGHVELDSPMACLVLNAADEKNGKGSDIPLRADLAADLREWINDKRSTFCGPDEEFRQKPLFNIPSSINRSFDSDLKFAGIPKRDDRKRVVDLHALRTTFGTLLSAGGISPRTTQEAMRHSDIRLTMGVYTDPRLLDVHGAMSALPDLPLNPPEVDSSAVRRATGTTGANSLHPPLHPLSPVQSGHSGASPVHRVTERSQEHPNEPFDVTSTPVTKKGPLTSPVSEPFEIAPLGFEPRLIESESIVLPLH